MQQVKLPKNIYQIKVIFHGLRYAVLKLKAKSYSFVLKDINYLCYVINWKGIEINMKKVKGIMDLSIPTTTIYFLLLIGMVHYFKDIWIRRLHIIYPMIAEFIGTKGKKILRNNKPKVTHREIKKIVSVKILLNYPYWKIIFTIHTDASEKQLGDIISQGRKIISFYVCKTYQGTY